MNRHFLNLVAANIGIDEATFQNDSDLEHAVLQALTTNAGGALTALAPNPVSVKAIADGTTTAPDA